ncbi:MAG: hypothetical protein WC650_02400 [Candidatus Doudnabacteria bacterium]
MAKQEAEWSKRLSIFWLKKHGYLDGGWQYGSIKWTYGMSGNESSIGFNVMINGDEGDNIRLQYTYTSRGTDEKESMDYRVELTTTPCNYGGKRYWFICPLTKDGKYCGRRVGVLFSIGKWFGCRHCGNIAYQSQFEGGNIRTGSVFEPDVEKAYNEVKLQYYNGKPTRKYKRYLRLRQKMDNSWAKAALKFGIKF